MFKIATHDSATGEKPANLLSWLLIPFARTQSKTIKQQYDAGCRMFDLRIRRYKGLWHLAHGLYITKKRIYDILLEINAFKESCYVSLTYEGRLNEKEEIERFRTAVIEMKRLCPNIQWQAIAVKRTTSLFKIDWDIIIPADCDVVTKQGFLPLDITTWHSLIPIPWLWKKLYFNNPKFNNSYYLYVDFL